MKSLPKANLSSEGRFISPEFRVLPELSGGLRLCVEFEIPSELRFVGAVTGYFSQVAKKHGFVEEIWSGHLPLALDEAITNAICHGNKLEASKVVRLSCELNDGELEISVEDEGEGFDPDSLPDPRKGDSLYRPNGRGVFLIRRLCDQARFENGGRRAVMIFRRESA